MLNSKARSIDRLRTLHSWAVTHWPAILLADFCELAIMNIADDRDVSGVPVICSKCNATFQSDSEYMGHHAREHSDE